MIRFFFGVFAVTFFLIIYSGCSSTPPVEKKEVEILSAERLINKLEANRRKIKNFEGTGTIYVKTKQFENSASFRIVVIKPDSIYLNILGPFGIEIAQILVTKNNFIFYEALNNVAYTGSVEEEVLKEIFKVNLSFADLVDAFTGGVNLSERLYKTPSHYDVVQDKYLLTYIDSLKNNTVRYTVDVRDLSIIFTQLEDLTGTKLLTGNYSDFRIVETIPVPGVIKLDSKTNGQYIEITYDEFAANKKNLFINFSLPDDADIISW